MECEADVGKLEGRRTIGRKHRDIVGWAKAFGDLVGRVMVSVDDGDRNTCVAQSREVRLEEHRRVEVVTVTIEQVAGDGQTRHGLAHGQLDEVLEGPSRRSPDLLEWGALVPGETAQGAVEMQVRAV